MIDKIKAQKSMNSVRRILRSRGIPFKEEGNLLFFTYNRVEYALQRRVWSDHTRILVWRNW